MVPNAATPPAAAAQRLTKLELRIHKVRCDDETNGFLGSEAGSDEIDLGGTTVDESGDTHKVSPFRVASFGSDGDQKVFSPPRRFTFFNLTEGTDFPKGYVATLVLAEIDSGGFNDFLKKLMEKVRERVIAYLTAAIGGAIGASGGPIGVAHRPRGRLGGRQDLRPAVEHLERRRLPAGLGEHVDPVADRPLDRRPDRQPGADRDRQGARRPVQRHVRLAAVRMRAATKTRTVLATAVLAAAWAIAVPAGPAHAEGSCNGVDLTLPPGTSGPDIINGTPARDVISAGSGNDTVRGNGGDDLICLDDGGDVAVGGTGNDVVFGGLGNDWSEADSAGTDGRDQFIGGAGIDTVDYENRLSAVSVSLNDLADDGVPGENDNARTDVENVRTGQGNDIVTGSGLANFVLAGSGDDLVTGRRRQRLARRAGG